MFYIFKVFISLFLVNTKKTFMKRYRELLSKIYYVSFTFPLSGSLLSPLSDPPLFGVALLSNLLVSVNVLVREPAGE